MMILKDQLIMTDAEIKLMNKTARSGGAVGKKAIIPRYIINHPWMHGYRMLDFGAGPKALHTKMLREQGMQVDCFDIGDNYVPGVHILDNGQGFGSYDLVFASNVINVQPTVECLMKTLEKMSFYTGNICIFNLPDSPRKLPDLTKEKMMEYACKVFKCVMLENYDGHKVFSCYKYGHDDIEDIDLEID